MTNKEILLVITDMKDEMLQVMWEMKGEIRELKEDVKVLKEDVKVLKEDVKVLKEDVEVLKEDVEVLKEDVEVLKKKIGVLEEVVDNLFNGQMRLEETVKKIHVTQEYIVLPRLNEITDCYTTTYKRYVVSVEEHEQMKQDISVLNTVVEQHSSILKKIS